MIKRAERLVQYVGIAAAVALVVAAGIAPHDLPHTDAVPQFLQYLDHMLG